MTKQCILRMAGLLCSLMLVIGGAIQPAWADKYPDIQESSYQQAIEILTAMGIVEGNEQGDFEPDKNVTRAEMVTIMLRALNISAEGQMLENSFTDTSEHWAKEDISLAQELGYVEGNGDGTFEPDADVTFEQAVKMGVVMINYAMPAEDRGGFPVGYISVAGSKGILDGVNGESGMNMSRGQVAQLIYNTMQVPMLIQDVYGENSSYHEGTENDTLMERFMAFPQDRGVVTAVSYTALDSMDGTMQKDLVEITVKEVPYLMYVGNTAAQQYLGREVDFRAVKSHRDSTRYTLIYIQPSERCETLTLTSDEIDKVEPDSMEYTYTTETGRSRTVRMEEGSVLIYNNQYLEEPSQEDMIPQNGFVVLADNNGNSGYDVAFVYEYTDMILSSSRLEGDVLTIYFKSGSKVPLGQIEIDRSDTAKTVIMYLDGQYLTMDEMFETEWVEWTVASVAKSKSSDVYELRLSTASVTGTITGERTEEGSQQYSINGTWYKTTPDFSDNVRLGEDYTFLLTYENKIAAVNTQEKIAKQEYALLLQTAMINQTFDDGNPEFKMIMPDGKITVFQGADKIRLNHSAAKQLTKEDLDSIPDNSLVQFTQNSQGEISALETADRSNVCTTTNGYIDYGEENIFTLNASTDLYFKKSSPATLGGDVKVDANTLVFDVSSPEEEEWGAGDISLFSDETVYTVDIYDLDRFKNAAVVVNYGPTVEQKDLVPWNGAPVVIESLITTLDEEGDQVTAVVGMQNGHDFQMNLRSEDVCDEEKENYLTQLEPGSVVQIKSNMLNEIVSIRKLYRAPNSTTVYENFGSKNWNGTDYNVKLHTGYGMCVDANEEVITVAYRLDKKVRSYSISQANIYVFDSRTRTVRIGTVFDIKQASSYGYDDCSKVFLRMEKDDVKDIVIYE